MNDRTTSTDFYHLDAPSQAACMQQLALAALPHWEIRPAEVSLIKYRENAVFKITAEDGRHYALRIHRHAYHTDQELLSELQWIAALANGGLEVTPLLPACTGALFVTVSVDAVPEPRQVDLFAWVNGRQLGSVEAGIAVDSEAVHHIYRTIGTLAARVHNHASDWMPPAGFTRHAWDAEGLAGATPFWGKFWELRLLTDDQRELLCRARDRVYGDLQAYASVPENRQRYSMIHADFCAENLMVEEGCVRLIDFDDAGFGWHLFELATAMYFEIGEDHYEEAFQALIEGYREYRSLPDEQVAQLPLFFLARSFTYLGWIHTRQETETAKTLGPLLIVKACALANDYLKSPR
jgi:Ser/Thr protein kinase RdoA (MazF antagonist)